MVDIDNVMDRCCEAGAWAMSRYAGASAESLTTLPEYFMPAIVCDRIADDSITVTLETGFSKLREYNDESRKRCGLEPRSPQEVAALLRLAEELGTPRVDLVLYQGPKTKLEILALVEFKRWGPTQGDRSKLRRILPHIDTCSYGVTCGFVNAKDLEKQRKEAEEKHDRWFQSKPVPEDSTSYYFCARLFDRLAQP